MIKLLLTASDALSADSSSMGSRRSSQRSIASTSSATSTSVATSSGVSRSPSSLLTQSPDVAPPIDPSAIMELEMAARRVADNMDLMMGNLRNNLHKVRRFDLAGFGVRVGIRLSVCLSVRLSVRLSHLCPEDVFPEITSVVDWALKVIKLKYLSILSKNGKC